MNRDVLTNKKNRMKQLMGRCSAINTITLFKS